MPKKKKEVPPAETPEAEIVNPAPETALETPSTPPAQPQAPETPPAPEGRPAIVTAAKGLNLREGPGFGFEVLTALESGTLVLILDLPMGVKVPGWELVDAGGPLGWVSDRFLRPLME